MKKPDSSENPLVQEEKEKFKFGVLSTALGITAIIGSLAIPNHSRPLENLQISLEVAGLLVAAKGLAQALEANDEIDKLR